MGKKSYPKRPSGIERSRIKSFENTAGIELKRVGGKIQRELGEEKPSEEELINETTLYLAPIQEIPIKLSEIKPSFKEQFMRGLGIFFGRERSR
jgi:hypothetical protein